MLDILDLLGIHTGDIEHAEGEIRDALSTVFLSHKEDEVVERVSKCLQDGATNIFKDPTNTIIENLFEVTRAVIEEEYPDMEMDYYVNGYDSHFYITDFDIFNGLYEKNIFSDDVKAIYKSGLCEIFAIPDIVNLYNTDNFNAFVDGGLDNIFLYENQEEVSSDGRDADEYRQFVLSDGQIAVVSVD